MGSNPRLDVRPTFVPKTISDFLGELTAINSVSERLLRFDEFVKRLEEEMRKIDAFKRELPLCMLLLNDAIVTLKEESVQCRTRNVEPILEEFIPLKKNCDEVEKREAKNEMDSRDKKNWMSSVQLWNNDDHSKTIDFKFDQKQNPVAQVVKGTGQDCPLVSDDPFQTSKNRINSRAFMPFKGCSDFPSMVTKKREKGDFPVAGLSLLTPGLKDPREEVGTNGLSSKISASSRSGSSTTPSGNSNLRPGPQPSQHQSSRKQRRCWSPELHRRFVNALQQLGGSQVATPKQIRELMQVDGLTNDEVKSHLQKYRLHTRRLPTANTASANESMVVLGGLWMSQDQQQESSTNQSSSQSGSPTGPLQLSTTGGGTSTTCGDSMEDEEEDDEKSESFNWKSHVQSTGKVHV